jgi:hypothetical protein
MADNVRNEEVTIHRSQEVLKMLFLYTEIFFAINFFVKNTGPTILLGLTAHQTPSFTGWSCALRVICGFCELK